MLMLLKSCYNDFEERQSHSSQSGAINNAPDWHTAVAGSIPAALFAFAQESLQVEQKHSAHAFEIILQ